MPDRSRSPRGAAVPSEADLRAALAAAEAALATERDRAARDRRRYLSALYSTYEDAHMLAVLASRAGASGSLVDLWYTWKTPADPEPEAEPPCHSEQAVSP